MSTEEKNKKIEDFIRSQILILEFKPRIINKTSKVFDIPKEETKRHYKNAMYGISKPATLKAFISLLIGIPALGVGIFGTFGNTGFIFFGAIIVGIISMIFATGLFTLAIIYRNKNIDEH